MSKSVVCFRNKYTDGFNCLLLTGDIIIFYCKAPLILYGHILIKLFQLTPFPVNTYLSDCCSQSVPAIHTGVARLITVSDGGELPGKWTPVKVTLRMRISKCCNIIDSLGHVSLCSRDVLIWYHQTVLGQPQMSIFYERTTNLMNNILSK